MAFWESDEDDGQHERWLHERITVVEPFRTRFRLRETGRYDLLANMAKALNLPPQDFEWSTERFVACLYNGITDAWEAGLVKADRDQARSLLKAALWHLNDDEVEQLVEDFLWSSNLKLHVVPDTYIIEMRKAVAGRLAPRVERLLRSLNRAAAERAA